MKVHATDTRVSVSLGISTDAVIRAVYEVDQQEAALSSGDDPWANPDGARDALDGLLGVSLTPTQARELARDLYQAAATCDARTYPPRDEHPAEVAARRYGRD